MSRMVMAPSLGVRGASLELHHVRLLELHLARILDDDDALAVRNEARQRVEHRGLAAARAAGDDHVALRDDERAQCLRGVVGQGVELDETLDCERLLEETANRHVRAIRSDRRKDGLDARAVGHAALEDRTLGADRLSDVLGEIPDRRGERLLVLEARVDERQNALSLDVDLVRTVDHDLAHRRIVQIRTDGREEREQGLLEYLGGDHGTVLMRFARATSACSPSGAAAR
jgi:hypothetical protein